MHLVKKQDVRPIASIQVAGFAGWVIESIRTLWLGAAMRRGVRKQMCVLETLSIGGRKQLVLVSCGGEQFLVGTGADSVQTIVHVHRNSTHDETSKVRGFGDRP